MNIQKCSVTKLKKRMTDKTKKVISPWMERWKLKVEVRKEREQQLIVKWGKAGCKGKKPSRMRKSKKGKIPPFLVIHGKEVAETLEFRMLGHRNNFNLSGNATVEYAGSQVAKSMWATRWIRLNMGTKNHCSIRGRGLFQKRSLGQR